MSKVELDTLKPWITQKITDVLGFEDDVVIEFIFNQLEERVCFSFLFAACLFGLLCYVLFLYSPADRQLTQERRTVSTRCIEELFVSQRKLCLVIYS